MNNWNGIGRLTRDPELRYSGSGTAICNFTVAVDRKFKGANGEKEADFIPVVTFKQLAELVANHLSKGKLVGVEGRIQTRTYEGNDGQKRYVTEIIADSVQFLSPKDSSSGGNSANPPASSFGHEVDLDSDIPF